MLTKRIGQPTEHKDTDTSITLSERTAYQYQPEHASRKPANELSHSQPKITLGNTVDLELKADRVRMTRKDNGLSFDLTEAHVNLRFTLSAPNLLVCTSILNHPKWCKVYESYHDGKGLLRVFDLNDSGRCLSRSEYEQNSESSLPVESLACDRVLVDHQHCYSIRPTINQLFSLAAEVGSSMVIPGSNLFITAHYENTYNHTTRISTRMSEARIYELSEKEPAHLHSIKLESGATAWAVNFEPESSTIRMMLRFQSFSAGLITTTQQELRLDVAKLFANRISGAVPDFSPDQAGIVQSYLTGCSSTFHKQKKDHVKETVRVSVTPGSPKNA